METDPRSPFWEVRPAQSLQQMLLLLRPFPSRLPFQSTQLPASSFLFRLWGPLCLLHREDQKCQEINTSREQPSTADCWEAVVKRPAPSPRGWPNTGVGSAPALRAPLTHHGSWLNNGPVALLYLLMFLHLDTCFRVRYRRDLPHSQHVLSTQSRKMAG